MFLVCIVGVQFWGVFTSFRRPGGGGEGGSVELGGGVHFYCIYDWVDWVWYGHASQQGHESSVYKVVAVLVLVLVENC